MLSDSSTFHAAVHLTTRIVITHARGVGSAGCPLACRTLTPDMHNLVSFALFVLERAMWSLTCSQRLDLYLSWLHARITNNIQVLGAVNRKVVFITDVKIITVKGYFNWSSETHERNLIRLPGLLWPQFILLAYQCKFGNFQRKRNCCRI